MTPSSGSLYRNRHYRLFLQAASVSNLGDGISLLALPWLASLITRDAASIAMVTAALRLPWLLFSLPAGVLADRFDRRVLVLWADAIRLMVLTALVLALSGLQSLDQLSPGTSQQLMLGLTAVAFILGMAEVLRDNTAQTLLPAIVPQQQLEKANGHLWSAEQLVGQFVGPPLAGWLLLQSHTSPFILNALCIALAWFFVYSIRLPAAPTATRNESVLRQMREALAWLYAKTQLFRLALMLGLINSIAVGSVTVLLLFSQDILGLDAAQHGFLLTAGAVGGVLGGVLCPHIIERLGSTRSVHVALFLFAVPWLIIALSDSVLWVAAALLLEMFAALLWNIVTVSWRQRSIPTALLGRVNSVYRLIGWGMMPLGAMAAGLIVELAQHSLPYDQSLRAYYFLAFALCVLLFIYGVCKLRIDSAKE